MTPGVEKLQSIEINKELSPEESKTIESLDVKDFDEKWDQEKLKKALTDTPIKIDSMKDGMKLFDIATDFDKYVKKWEGWKLELKDENDKSNPEWIKNIINKPANNDLAYLVQKLSFLIKYQTAKAYTENELKAVEVKVDKKFGNQTKNALAGLKNWITNSETTKTFTSKDFLKGIVSWVTSQTEVDINKALENYHVTYNKSSDDFALVNWYDRIDKYGNNLATKIATDDNNVSKEKTPDTKITNETSTNKTSTNKTSIENDLLNGLFWWAISSNTEKMDVNTTVESINNYWNHVNFDENTKLKDIITEIPNNIAENKDNIALKTYNDKFWNKYYSIIDKSTNKIKETGKFETRKNATKKDNDILDINFESDLEAVAMANFINYIRSEYKGKAWWSSPFNRWTMRWWSVWISLWNREWWNIWYPDLEFDESGTPWDKEIINWSEYPSAFPSLKDQDNRIKFMDFLNNLESWE